MKGDVFVPVLKGVPTDFAVDTDGQLSYVDTLVAVRRDQRFTVGVRSILDPFERDATAFLELSFAISVFDEERYSADLIFCPVAAKPYLPEDVRPFIMDTVCAQIRTLIGEVGPKLIFRQTSALSPPEKALPKHQMITDTLVSIGYVQKQHDSDPDGGLFWVFARETEDGNG